MSERPRDASSRRSAQNEAQDEPTSPEHALRCSGCEREIEWCSFCDDERCGVSLCYRCVIIELGEALPPLHAHGG